MCTHVGSAPDIVGPFIFRLSTTCPNTLILRTDLPNALTLSQFHWLIEIHAKMHTMSNEYAAWRIHASLALLCILKVALFPMPATYVHPLLSTAIVFALLSHDSFTTSTACECDTEKVIKVCPYRNIKKVTVHRHFHLRKVYTQHPNYVSCLICVLGLNFNPLIWMTTRTRIHHLVKTHIICKYIFGI